MSSLQDSIVPHALDDRRANWTRLLVGRAVQSGDPNAIEDPADRFADQADGSIEGSLLGGLATNNFDDARWWTWRAVDIFGRNPTATQIWQAYAQVRERLAPGLATDTYVVAGLCNDSNLASATVEGIGVGIVYAGATRTLRATQIKNGAVSNFAPAATIGLRRATISPNRIANLTYLGVCNCSAQDDSGNDQGPNVNLGFNEQFSAGNLHWFLAFGRSAATAGTVTIGTAAFEIVYPEPSQGRVPT
ncbi:MAG: hypothetical protein QME96_06590 [Myxococcota bacterium]|nr:hypothetical protein [Myxococcota bacterium]